MEERVNFVMEIEKAERSFAQCLPRFCDQSPGWLQVVEAFSRRWLGGSEGEESCAAAPAKAKRSVLGAASDRVARATSLVGTKEDPGQTAGAFRP
jgi:hypothetical protein